MTMFEIKMQELSPIIWTLRIDAENEEAARGIAKEYIEKNLDNHPQVKYEQHVDGEYKVEELDLKQFVAPTTADTVEAQPA